MYISNVGTQAAVQDDELGNSCVESLPDQPSLIIIPMDLMSPSLHVHSGEAWSALKVSKSSACPT